MDTFLSWLVDTQDFKNFGTQVSNHNITNRRGVYATQNFADGSVLCALPTASALVLEEDETTLSERAFTAWQLLHTDAFLQAWKPFVDILPTKTHQFSPTPDFWSRDEIQQLELPELVEEVLDQKAELEEFLEALKEEGDLEILSLEDLQFCSWLVTSRSFSIVKEDAQQKNAEPQVQCIWLPFFDLVNHPDDSSCANTILDIQESTGCFVLRAKGDIASGEEVTLSYGTGEDESMDLLINYGFIPIRNINDVHALEGDRFDEWSTTVEEDVEELATLTSGLETTCGSIRETILQLRIKLKRAMDGHA